MAAFRNRNFWLIGLSYLLIAFSILIPFAFLPTYATQELLIPYTSATRLIAVIAVAGVCGKLVLSHLSDFVGRVRIMKLCGAFVAAGGLGMVYAQESSMLAVSAAVLGIGYGATWPVYAASARDFFPQEYSGSIVGLWTVCLGIGSTLSPIITGWTIDVTGRYGWAFILVTISAAMSSLLLFPIAKIPTEPYGPQP